MQPIRLILVAIKEPGPGCHRTVMNAARLARGLGADLELFHAIDTPVYVDTANAADDWSEQTQRDTQLRCSQQLERIAARLRKYGFQVGTAAEWDHPACDAIVRHADRVGADVIVAERHAGRHAVPALLHTTDWELIRLSPVPTLLVGASTPPYRHPVILAAVDPSHAHAKPAALDEEILRAGSVVTGALRGTLHAMHAYLPMPIGMPPEILAAEPVVRDIESEATAQARQNFERLLASVDIPTERRHLIGSSVKDAIKGTIRSLHCSVIVLGAVSRGGLKGLLIGNTAERVLDDLTCDLLVVKPKEFESRVSRTPRGARFAAGAPVP